MVEKGAGAKQVPLPPFGKTPAPDAAAPEPAPIRRRPYSLMERLESARVTAVSWGWGLGEIGAAAGVVIGLVLAAVAAVERGAVPAATVVGVFGAVLFAFGGAIYGALVGAVVGAVSGAMVGIVRPPRNTPGEKTDPPRT
jgi:hypothetical protein